MKKFLFNAVGRILGSAISIVTLITNALVWAGNTVNQGFGKLGYSLMYLIDKERLKVYEELMNPETADQLHRQGLELKLLASAQQVRDHAKETGDWTGQHTEALNALGDALINETGWEEENVHVYLKELVESIDGLQYGPEEW